MAEDSSDRETAFVDEAFEKWGTRYVANGLVFHDVEQIQANVSSWSEWCDGFSAVGEKYQSMAEEAETAGNLETAGQHFVKAGLCFHFGSHTWSEDEDQRDAAQRRSVELFKRAGPFLDPPIEYRTAPYDAGGYEVPYHLRVPDRGPTGDQSDSPIVLLIPGSESNKEEQFARSAALNERGLATAAIDGPGQGETLANQAMTPDYADPISAVIDDLEETDPAGVDTDRIGIFGVSLGGFYAPFVASQDDRIGACVGISGKFTVGPISYSDFDILLENYLRACKADSLMEVDEITELMTLRGRIDELTCPTLIATGSDDPITDPIQTERIARRAPNAEFHLVEGGTHCALNLVDHIRPKTADWIRAALD